MVVIEGPTPQYRETQRAIDLSFKDQEEKEKQRVKEKEQNVLRNTINQKAFLEAQCLLITRRRLPRNFVNWPEFHALLYTVNPLSPEVTISASSTASAYIEKSFKRHQETIKRTLHKSRSLIHFSINLWSAPGAKSLFGAHVQWVDDQFKLRKALLGLPQVTFSHSGENQAAHLMDIIQEFELAHLIGYFTTNNASSNNTLLETLAKNLLVKYGARINPQKRQIRCLSHIINLTLSTFLFADNKTALEEVLKEIIEEEEEASVCELLIKKLKNIKGLKGRKNKKKDILTEEEWEQLKGTKEFLQPFYQATLKGQQEFVSLNQALFFIDVLFKHFEEAKVCDLTSRFTYAYNLWQCQYAENAVLKNSINMGWIQLRKYYEKTDECPAYATALLLYPAYQAKYININWLEEWRPSAFESARIIWAEYKDRPVTSRLQSTRVLDKPPTKFDTLRHALKVTDHNEEEDELEKFLNGVPILIFSTPL